MERSNPCGNILCCHIQTEMVWWHKSENFPMETKKTKKGNLDMGKHPAMIPNA